MLEELPSCRQLDDLQNKFKEYIPVTSEDDADRPLDDLHKKLKEYLPLDAVIKGLTGILVTCRDCCSSR